MLTSLGVSSWAFKCACYRPEQNTKKGTIELNFEGLEMKK